MAGYLSRHHFRVNVVHDGGAGIARALAERYDLVLLDVMLPTLSGFDVLRYLRRRSRVPIIMVTARGAEGDRVIGLRAGADDYLPKPFDPEELVARIEAVLRRSGHYRACDHEVIEAAGLTLNVDSREVHRDGRRIELTPVETDILELLMRSAGRAVSRDEMAAVLHSREATAYERSVDVHISHLRRKLDSSNHSLVRSVRGIGYIFTGH